MSLSNLRLLLELTKCGLIQTPFEFTKLAKTLRIAAEFARRLAA